MLVAETGRAGTSFLVHYLSALGLETEIDRSGVSRWDDDANAGLETRPIETPSGELPYVIKSPWIGEFVDQVLGQQDLAIDLVVVPTRDLVDSAASRTILEMRAIHDRANWMVDFDRTWETWGWTPGGVVFSLNPLDQARILAVGFHRLIQRLVDEDIPILFLGFPRLISDGDYLFSKLRPYLPETITAEKALAAHRALADPAKIRTEQERQPDAPVATADSPAYRNAQHSAHEQIDHIAIRRELKRLRTAHAENQLELQRMRGEIGELARTGSGLAAERDTLVRARDELSAERDTLLRASGELGAERDLLVRREADLKDERDTVVRTCADLRSERDAFAAARNASAAELETVSRALEAAIRDRDSLLASRSWRVTAALRALVRAARPLRRRI